MLIKKFLRDFDDLSDEVGVGEQPESNVTFGQYKLILKKMHFIGTESKLEISLVDQVWAMIKDERNSNITKKHSMKVILAAIMGYSSKWMYTSHVQKSSGLRMST